MFLSHPEMEKETCILYPDCSLYQAIRECNAQNFEAIDIIPVKFLVSIADYQNDNLSNHICR